MGSNPTVTASENPRETGGFLHSLGLRGAFLVHCSEIHGLYQVFYRARMDGSDVLPSTLRRLQGKGQAEVGARGAAPAAQQSGLSNL